MFKLLAIPLGYIMKACYLFVSNYGIALLLFTLIIKIILLPLSIKQQKSIALTAQLNPKIKILEKKYANNKEKLNEERMKLYSEENINPMASCLPMVVTMLILFSLIEVIYYPMTHITNLSDDEISKSTTLMTNLATVSEEVKESGTTFVEIIDSGEDLQVVLTDSAKYEKLAKISEADMKGVISAIEKHPEIDNYFNDASKVSKQLRQRPQLMIFGVIDNGLGDIFDANVNQTVSEIDFTFFGIFLGGFPRWNNTLVLIPIFSLLSQLAMTFVSMYYSKRNNSAIKMNGSMNTMMYIMPLFSFWIAFNYPAGLGLYWTISSVLSIGQTVFLNKMYSPEKMAVVVARDAEKNKGKKKRRPSMYERAMAAQQQQKGEQGTESNPIVINSSEGKLSKSELKEYQRQRLNEARRRMAEKYGDNYSEND